MEINKRVYRGRSRGHLPRGVRKCRAGYRAEVSVGGVLHHLGVYSTQGEAAASYWREKGRIQQTGRGIREVAIIRAAHNDNIVPVQKELPLDSGGPKRGNAKWSVLEIRQVLELISQGTSIADIAVIIERTEGAVLQRYVKLVQAGEGTFEKHKLPVLTPAARYGVPSPTTKKTTKKTTPAPQKRSTKQVAGGNKSRQGWWNKLWHGDVRFQAVDTELAAMHLEMAALKTAHNNLLVQLGEEPSDVH